MSVDAISDGWDKDGVNEDDDDDDVDQNIHLHSNVIEIKVSLRSDLQVEFHLMIVLYF